jgi:branched-chain amino acid transport system substrate-binding protein
MESKTIDYYRPGKEANMLTKRFTFILIILSLLLSSCGSLGTKTVKVAVSLPQSLDYPKDMLNAIQLAVSKTEGKTGNVKVEIVTFSYSDPNGEAISTKLAQQNAEDIAKDPSIVAMLGPANSSAAKVIIPILNEASVPLIGLTTTWPGLTKPGYGPGEPGIYYPNGRRNFFRTVPSDELQGSAAARWAVKLGYQKAYIVHGAGSYEEGVAGVFELTAKDLGIQILGKDTFPIAGEMTPGQLQAIADHVTAANPNMVYLGGSFGSNGELIAQVMRKANPSLPILMPDGLQVADLIKFLGPELANNIYATTVALPVDKLETKTAADFSTSFQEAYGKKPSAYDAATYEAANVLLYAIGRAKQPTREGVLDSLQNFGDYQGIFGTWHFDQQGDISFTGISGMQVQSGAWVFVEALK